MAASKSHSFLSQSRFSDTEKMEGTGSWEAIEWTKNEPLGRTVAHGFSRFLFEAEEVIREGYGVVLVNTDEAGTLLVTNYRLLFVSEKTRDIIALGTIPLAAIEKFNKLVVKQTSGSRQSDKSSARRLLQASTFRARCRLPTISWCHPGTGAVLARSSQPLVGLMMNMRSNADEKLVAALCTQFASLKDGRRKLYIADARPRKNALANGAMGGGSESAANYFQSEIVFFGIDNIHAMRDSLSRLREYLDTYGTTSSDGMSSYLRHGGSTWGGGNLSSMSTSVSTLGDSGWLIHVQSVLAGAAWIAARIAKESASVLVHCSDGWDRTTQLVSLASLLLDPYYRTIKGFQALVEKDWLAFGHPFSDRIGLPSLSGSGTMPLELSSSGSFHSSPIRQQSGSTQPSGSSHTHSSHSYSPILLQWVDCVSQLLRMYPFAFEFSSAFLVDFLDSVLSCRFGNFLCNSERERQQCRVSEACGCLWSYLDDMLSCGGQSHAHYNLFYDPMKHDGPLLPPAAALAPTLWPQFHLRWACPKEVEAGDLDAKCRSMANKFSELQKDTAERKAREITAAMESLTTELRNEKQLSSTAVHLAKKASKENAAIKRAIQSLGCKIHFSSSGDTTVDVEHYKTESPQKSIDSLPERDSDRMLQCDEKSDLSVSIALMPDDDVPTDSFSRICESLCPLRSPDGQCRWPEAGCAQIGSQFVGLKANFDAFDRLSIDDGYF
uniref:phosphatidylinositol-3,5-bisphosphate 3-phosphatase n=1 Tax=Chenopodium quinoa TaxID=63459 RepID=A0A803N727_CHEQI